MCYTNMPLIAWGYDYVPDPQELAEIMADPIVIELPVLLVTGIQPDLETMEVQEQCLSQ